MQQGRLMKAVQLTGYGLPETAVSLADIPRPVPEAEQVLVKVFATSINPFDYKLISGMYKDHIPLKLPVVPGGDMAGVVEAVGSEVADIRVGDEVYGGANVLSGGSGAFAQYAVAGAAQVAVKPSVLTFPDAASLPLVGVSAVQALQEHIGLEKGQTILIHGAGGGIGSVAVQLAKAIGATVIATAGADDLPYVRRLGADTVIDYKKTRFEQTVHQADAVFDTVGGEVTSRSLSVLRKGGIIVSMLGVPEGADAKRGITAIGQQTRITRARLERLSEYVEQGLVKPRISKTFGLQDIHAALSYARTGHPSGKVVLSVE